MNGKRTLLPNSSVTQLSEQQIRIIDCRRLFNAISDGILLRDARTLELKRLRERLILQLRDALSARAGSPPKHSSAGVTIKERYQPKVCAFSRADDIDEQLIDSQLITMGDRKFEVIHTRVIPLILSACIARRTEYFFQVTRL